MATNIFPSNVNRAATLIPATAVATMAVSPNLQLGTIVTSTTSASTQTALNITASSGALELASLGNSSGSTLTASLLKITIDGVVVYNETGSIGNTQIKNSAGGYGATTNSATGSLAKIPFNVSLLIEFASDGTNLGTLFYRYYLT